MLAQPGGSARSSSNDPRPLAGRKSKSPDPYAATGSEEPVELLEYFGTGVFAHTDKAGVLDEDLREEHGADEVALKILLNRKKERALKREFELNASLSLRLIEFNR